MVKYNILCYQCCNAVYGESLAIIKTYMSNGTHFGGLQVALLLIIHGLCPSIPNFMCCAQKNWFAFSMFRFKLLFWLVKVGLLIRSYKIFLWHFELIGGVKVDCVKRVTPRNWY